MPRLIILSVLLATLLTACAPDPRDAACKSQSTSAMRWGYYPGYGCGPVPRAQTFFS
jgi:hypothetical protein